MSKYIVEFELTPKRAGIRTQPPDHWVIYEKGLLKKKEVDRFKVHKHLNNKQEVYDKHVVPLLEKLNGN